MSSPSSAGVLTDGTVGAARSLAGPDYQISRDLGTISGNNLFHSFSNFFIAQDESAIFTGPDHIANVISRVTGGQVSTIDGLLRSEVGQADFFLVNPAGVVFGPNARVDVPAAFHVSTADELRFEDGSVFSAIDPGQGTLSLAEPISFGYLNQQPAAIVVNGSQLTFAPESKVALVGGDLTIKGTENQEAALVSEGGEIRLTAVGEQGGTVPLRESGAEEMEGDIVVESADLDTSGPAGARVVLGAGEARISAATISANNRGDTDDSGGGVEIRTGAALTVNRGSRIESNAFGGGASGGVEVQAESILIEQEEGEGLTGLFSEVEPEASGDAGGIGLKVKDTLQIQGGGVVTASTWGSGRSGPVTVRAGSVLFDGEGRAVSYRDESFQGGLVCLVKGDSTGKGGLVEVEVDGSLALLNAADISTLTLSRGEAGDVLVTAESLLLDGDRSFIMSASGSSGNAGKLEVVVDDLLEIKNGGIVMGSTLSDSGGDAGAITIRAGELKLEGGGGGISSIQSVSNSSSSGKAGPVEVNVDGLLELRNSALILSSTKSGDDAGGVTIRAGSMRIEGADGHASGISSGTYSTGRAGTVEVSVDDFLELVNGGIISSSTSAGGDAGTIRIRAGQLKLEDGEALANVIVSVAGTGSTGDAGTVEVVVDGDVSMTDKAIISSRTFAEGDAGGVAVSAGDWTMDGSGVMVDSTAGPTSTGNAGTVEVKAANHLAVLNGADISCSTYAEGEAGVVRIRAGQLRMDGDSTHLSTIQSTTRSISKAGLVEIDVDGSLEMSGGAAVSSSTHADGDAGRVVVQADAIRLDGIEGGFVGIFSDTNAGSGNAGVVEIRAADALEIINGATISSTTYSAGHAGGVAVRAGEIRIDENRGGFVGIQSDAFGQGNAGEIEIDVQGLLKLTNGGAISTTTYAAGDAGRVAVRAGEVKIAGGEGEFGFIHSETYFGTGNAGTVDVTVDRLLEVTGGGLISSSTYSEGRAGNVAIQAGQIRLEGGEGRYAGIYSDTGGGAGDAGKVDVAADGLLALENGAFISSETFSGGNAGNIDIDAPVIRIDGRDSEFITGVFTRAGQESSGYVGNISISADTLAMQNSGKISIAAFNTLPEDRLTDFPERQININSRQTHLDRARITAESSANVPAASVFLEADKLVLENESRITTSSRNADGGPVHLKGEVIFLKDGLVTTSVEGDSGNGGNILIEGTNSPADVLVFDGGFIQANTAAQGARGGDIFLDSRAVIGESGGLEVGGVERRTFVTGSGRNVIQAAAPGGEQGTIEITAPNLDISGSLVTLSAGFSEEIAPATDPCRAAAAENRNSLVFEGWGGLPPSPEEPVTADFMHRNGSGPLLQTGTEKDSSGKDMI